MNRSDIKEYFRNLIESTAKEQNKRSVLSESSNNSRKLAQGYEDNQTKMVRRYLIQIGKDELFASMSEKDIDALAADLRLMSPSEKKQRDLYDLSVPTNIWQRNRNLGQSPDGSNLQRINQMLANRPDEYEDEDPAYASQFGSHLDGDEYEEYEDVQAIAEFDALNDDKDETLYRDNPDYRRAYDIMANNPVPDAPSSPKYDTGLRRALFGSEYPDDSDEKADMSDEYRRMTLSPDRAYDK